MPLIPLAFVLVASLAQGVRGSGTPPKIGRIPLVRAPRAGERLPLLRTGTRIAWLPSVAEGDTLSNLPGCTGMDTGLASSQKAYTSLPKGTLLAALKKNGIGPMANGGYDVAKAMPTAKALGADYLGVFLLKEATSGTDGARDWVQIRSQFVLVGTDGKSLPAFLEPLEYREKRLRKAGQPGPTAETCGTLLTGQEFPRWFAAHVAAKK
ncbi:hypothetical protein EON81_20030 [bacterium]|nr:MAG: hypothetical protein EON81_20030 [bacterium]